MTWQRTVALLTSIIWLGTACADEDTDTWTLDQRSYSLGGMGAFAEMVDAGVKKLALSTALPADEMDFLIKHAERIAADHDVEIYRESDFLVTDLFSAELTDGMDVLLICHDEIRQEYMELKAAKQALVASNAYEGDARRKIAVRFGYLLSYSDEKIESLLSDR